MSDEPRYTEKEMVMAQRAAFLAGGCAWNGSLGSMKKAAAEKYPLPRVERPRVVTDPNGDDWRWTKERGLQLHLRGLTTWIEAEGGHIGPAFRETVADLLAHPSEFVDDEG